MTNSPKHSATADPPKDEEGNGVLRGGNDRHSKERSAEFLVEEFDVQTHDAADLVAENAPEAEKIEAHERQRQQEDDPLEDVPTPRAPHLAPEERVQRHMHKEVVRVRKS